MFRVFCSSLVLAPALFAAAPVEADYYKITTFETPKQTALEVGSIELLPEGKLAIGTRRGEVWIVSGAGSSDPSAVSYKLFASGLHEVLGLAYNPRDKNLYATTRYEITRLKDSDGDGRADVFDNMNDGWGVSGDYQERVRGRFVTAIVLSLGTG
jgi:glucose/arabinose dehydrogenase